MFGGGNLKDPIEYWQRTLFGTRIKKTVCLHMSEVKSTQPGHGGGSSAQLARIFLDQCQLGWNRALLIMFVFSATTMLRPGFPWLGQSQLGTACWRRAWDFAFLAHSIFLLLGGELVQLMGGVPAIFERFLG
jgi:hypothetical protein